MGGQSAFAFIDPYDPQRVDYYFMGDYALGDIESYLHEPYNVMYDCGKTLFQGNCTIEEFKSRKFADEHDLVGAAIIMPDSIVCFKMKTIMIYRRRRD
jgi:hypothetical protein